MHSGILCIDKPRGLTSHDVVDVVRRLLGQRSVGHTGTLDPDASGLLLLCIGRATKFARFFEGLDKTYWTVMQLGTCTDTQDATGQLTSRRNVPLLSPNQMNDILPLFTGSIKQTPPMYSALKYRGKRLYKLARRGQTVARQPRQVYIQQCKLLDLRGVHATLSVTCSKGTYIRTLCEDIGLAMGYGAHMVHLQRCAIGAFVLTQACTLEELQHLSQQGRLSERIIPLARALDFLPVLSLSSQQFQILQKKQGRALSEIFAALPEPPINAGSYRLRTQRHETFAVIHRHTTDNQAWKLSYLEIP
jgi:tRNA pseudouridine55 synthase